MLPGENRRERVLSQREEQQYLAAATDLGHQLSSAYRDALQGIRAVKQTVRLRENRVLYLLQDAATVLIDTGLQTRRVFPS